MSIKNIKTSSRVTNLKESVTLAITAKAKELKSRGFDIIGFGAGEPDFDTPENIKAAAIRAIEAGHTKYTAVGGIPELKGAIIDKFRVDNDLSYTQDEILVSSGGKHSIYNLFQALLDPGEEVIIPSPYWVSYPPMVELAGGVPVIVTTSEAEGFKMTAEALKKHITKKTKAIIINSPSNPTGVTYTESELSAIAEVALSNNLLIVTDEIYEKLIYGGIEATSIAAISKEIKNSTIVLNGVSKAYSMTGWRIGYAAGSREIISAMGRIQSQSTSNPASISQWAAVEALNGPQDALKEMVKVFEKRRDLMVKGLNSIEGVSCMIPDGAFYAFANISGLIGKAAEDRGASGEITGSLSLADLLLNDAEVAVVPGIAFGCDTHIRLSYACSEEDIKVGLERMDEELGKLK
jgi:aspartate aminotransferase